jgi:hypothetical protein
MSRPHNEAKEHNGIFFSQMNKPPNESKECNGVVFSQVNKLPNETKAHNGGFVYKRQVDLPTRQRSHGVSCPILQVGKINESYIPLQEFLKNGFEQL